MQKHWKKIVIGLVAVVVIVIGASFIYAKFVNKADDEFDSDDVRDRLTTTIAPDTTGEPGSDPITTAPDVTDTDDTTAPSGDGVDGVWNISTGSEVGYRVDESINGFDTTANGRSESITGSFTIAGTAVTAGEWTVDMTTFNSPEDRRDGQFDGRIMDVATFPTSTFVLTAPIDFQQVPTDGSTITATATGDLTLRGVTKSVTFELEATFESGRVGVLGQIPIVFADYDIPNPSFGTISTDDHGLLEFVLIFDRA